MRRKWFVGRQVGRLKALRRQNKKCASDDVEELLVTASNREKDGNGHNGVAQRGERRAR